MRLRGNEGRSQVIETATHDSSREIVFITKRDDKWALMSLLPGRMSHPTKTEALASENGGRHTAF